MFKDYQPKIIIKPYQKRKKSWKKVLLGILLVSFVITLSVYLGLSFLVNKEVRNISELRQENNYLKKEIKKLKTSDEAYEEILRTKYGYIKNGEKIIVYSHSIKRIKKK